VPVVVVVAQVQRRLATATVPSLQGKRYRTRSNERKVLSNKVLTRTEQLNAEIARRKQILEDLERGPRVEYLQDAPNMQSGPPPSIGLQELDRRCKQLRQDMHDSALKHASNEQRETFRREVYKIVHDDVLTDGELRLALCNAILNAQAEMVDPSKRQHVVRACNHDLQHLKSTLFLSCNEAAQQYFTKIRSDAKPSEEFASRRSALTRCAWTSTRLFKGGSTLKNDAVSTLHGNTRVL
jgi:hypothetical protein